MYSVLTEALNVHLRKIGQSKKGGEAVKKVGILLLLTMTFFISGCSSLGGLQSTETKGYSTHQH